MSMQNGAVIGAEFDDKGRRLDAKGRAPVAEMNDIEMLTEITSTIRAIGDVVSVFEGLNPQQALGMILKGGF